MQNLITPWQHSSADPQRTSERYNAHNTGAILDKLVTDHGWQTIQQYSRRSHDPARRPFALHSAVLRHPEAVIFNALGRDWRVAVYLRNAHDSTAALNASLLLTCGRAHAATAFALAPASFRASHVHATDEQAQELALRAAQAMPEAVAQLMEWQATRNPGGYLDAVDRAMLIRFPDESERPRADQTPFLHFDMKTKLDYYLMLARLTLEGSYYLESSKRMLRPVKNIQARERVMRRLWELMQ